MIIRQGGVACIR